MSFERRRVAARVRGLGRLRLENGRPRSGHNTWLMPRIWKRPGRVVIVRLRSRCGNLWRRCPIRKRAVSICSGNWQPLRNANAPTRHEAKVSANRGNLVASGRCGLNHRSRLRARSSWQDARLSCCVKGKCELHRSLIIAWRHLKSREFSTHFRRRGLHRHEKLAARAVPHRAGTVLDWPLYKWLRRPARLQSRSPDRRRPDGSPRSRLR